MRLVLHHAPGCALSQAVRIALAEKGLAHEVRTVDVASRHPDFLALSPAGLVPVLEAGGAVLTEAFFILCYLEDAFPQPPLGGADPAARYRVQYVGKLVENAIAPNLALLEWAGGAGAMPADVECLPGERRALWRKAGAGFADADLAAGRVALERALADCEGWLAANAWLAGEDCTLADMLVAPLAARVPAPGPATSRWLARVRTRPAVAGVLAEPLLVTMGPERGRWG